MASGGNAAILSVIFSMICSVKMTGLQFEREQWTVLQVHHDSKVCLIPDQGAPLVHLQEKPFACGGKKNKFTRTEGLRQDFLISSSGEHCLLQYLVTRWLNLSLD